MKKFFAFVAAALTALTMNAANLSVADAITRGMALDSLATDSVEVTVEGYARQSGIFSLIYNNQTFYMADDATNSANQEFEAYLALPKDGNDTVRVIDGDKVQLTGKLYKYYDKTNKKFVIEVSKGVASIIEKVEGDRAIDRTIHEISIDSALAIGKKLASNDATPILYKVQGYVVGMINDKNNTYSDGGFAKYGNQSLWIAAAENGAADKDHAFEIYQGVGKAGDKKVEMKVGHQVSIICQIKNYNGTIENNDTKLNVEVLNYVEEKIDTITVAEAVEIALALENNKETDNKYAVLGYVKKIKEYNTDYKNQDFYIIDDLANKEVEDLNCYHTKIAAPGCAEGDRIIIVGKLKNSFNDKNSTNNAQITGGEAEILWKAGIEEVTLTEKAQKVMVDGVVYVIRNNKMFDLMGNQVR